MNYNFLNNFNDICKKLRLVGAASVIVKDLEVEDVCTYGFQDFETKELITEDSIFRIASISKIIVAMAVMKLVEENKVSLDEDISNIFGFPIRNPKFPNDKITIKMLMTQTSSISDGYDDENPEYDNIKKGYNGVNGTHLNVSLKDLLVPNTSIYWTDKTFNYSKPGTEFEYSNFGCGILACIVEKITNRLFTDFVKEEILDPLGLDASFRPSQINNKDKITTLYYPSNDDNLYKISRRKETFIENEYPIWDLGNNYRGPAGGLFISMMDLSKIMIVLMNDGKYKNIQILKKETVDLMLQQHWNGNAFNSSYKAKGLQIKVFDYFEDKLMKGHTGDAYGVKSMMFFNKEEKLGICYITNGGYYKLGPSLITDCLEDTLKAFLDNYWKANNKEFKFKINDNLGYINGRKIIFPINCFQNNDIYLPAISLGEGLSLIVKEEERNYTLSKNKIKIVFDKMSPSLINLNGILCLPVTYICNNLNLNIEIIDDIVTIKY